MPPTVDGQPHPQRAAPPTAAWHSLLVRAGVIDHVAEIGRRAFRRPAHDGLLGVTLSARGRTAIDAGALLAGQLCLEEVETCSVPDGDLIVLLADAVGPSKDNVTCDLIVPRPPWEVARLFGDSMRSAVGTGIRAATLRHDALGVHGTLFSVLIAPDGADPPYDAACVASILIDALRAP